jgi:peptidoglycan-associated lipoprotein
MLTYKNLTIALAGTVLLTLGGCAGKKAVKPAASTATSTIGETGNGAQSNGAGDARLNVGAAGEATNGSAPVGVARLVYFDFDSSEIRPEFVAVLATHARALAGNASIRVRLEGHTDERGSPEYNIGLGERRAQAVRRALLLQGVSEAQVATVSYGEERPAVAGQGEDAWAKNRRVEIVYQN